jgi:hypothetical protein
LNFSIINGIKVLENFFNTYSNYGGNGPYLIRDLFTTAEIMCAPIIQRLIPMAKHFIQLDLLKECEKQGAIRLLGWMVATLERESVTEVKVDDQELIEAYSKLREKMKGK